MLKVSIKALGLPLALHLKVGEGLPTSDAPTSTLQSSIIDVLLTPIFNKYSTIPLEILTLISLHGSQMLN